MKRGISINRRAPSLWSQSKGALRELEKHIKSNHLGYRTHITKSHRARSKGYSMIVQSKEGTIIPIEGRDIILKEWTS